MKNQFQHKGERGELFHFFAITFIWTWFLNLPRVLSAFGMLTISSMLNAILGYTSVFGPMAASFYLVAKKDGKKGINKIWRRGWNLSFDRKYLLSAILLMPANGLLTFLVMGVLNISVPWEYSLPWMLVIPIGLVIWLFGAYPEEFGWRGYALPRLIKFQNPLIASLLLGLIWGVWHLPLHFIPSTTQYVIPVWEYILQTMALSVMYTWLFQKTNGNLFVASLFHFSGNLTGALIPYWVSSEGRWISFILLLIPTVFAGLDISRSDGYLQE